MSHTLQHFTANVIYGKSNLPLDSTFYKRNIQKKAKHGIYFHVVLSMIFASYREMVREMGKKEADIAIGWGRFRYGEKKLYFKFLSLKQGGKYSKFAAPIFNNILTTIIIRRLVLKAILLILAMVYSVYNTFWRIRWAKICCPCALPSSLHLEYSFCSTLQNKDPNKRRCQNYKLQYLVAEVLHLPCTRKVWCYFKPINVCKRYQFRFSAYFKASWGLRLNWFVFSF